MKKKNDYEFDELKNLNKDEVIEKSSDQSENELLKESEKSNKSEKNKGVNEMKSNYRKNNQKKSNGILILVLILVLIIFIINFPNLYKLVLKLQPEPKYDENANKKEGDLVKKEVEELTDEVVNQVSFPIMRPNNYNENSYYQLNEFKISDMSNQDKLVNAYLAIDSIFIQNDSFDAKYIDLRMKNLLGKNTTYNLENFTVPESISYQTSNKSGTWVYNAQSNSYVYGGATYTYHEFTYLDVKELIKYERENNNVVIYYYVGFVKYSNNQYFIYSDANYKNLLTSGNVNSDTNYENIFKSLDKDKKIYKFTFSDSLCTYDDYCLLKGEWVSEL